MLIFIGCFVAIYQERVSPVSVVGVASTGTVLGWALWDRWVGQEEAARSLLLQEAERGGGDPGEEEEEKEEATATGEGGGGEEAGVGARKDGLGLGVSGLVPSTPGGATGHPTGASSFANYSYYPPYGGTSSSMSPRNQQRLATAKSAVLIYSALLGLSPILRSLTKSTTSDSIWAMSTWLMFINVFFFDYGGGVGAKYDA